MITKATNSKKNDAQKILEDLDGPLTFARLIKSIRLGREETQEAFGKKIGICKQNVCDLEKGRWLPSTKSAISFARKLGYSPEVFVKMILQEEINSEHLRLEVRLLNKTG